VTFWTEGRDPHKRNWQCFSCGVKFEDYALYVSHIIQEHEEGRDYVKCPVDSCGAPVRDLKAHFKTKHPNRAVPAGVQLKSTIWKDFSNNKRGKTRKPNFKEGWFESGKMSGKKMYYRSGYELDIFKCLDLDKDVKHFYSEPFKVPYYFDKEWHNYIPDIKVEFVDGVTEIWEIKPMTQLSLEKNQAKWVAMNSYAEKLGWGFTVITENGINLMKKKIRHQT